MREFFLKKKMLPIFVKKNEFIILVKVNERLPDSVKQSEAIYWPVLESKKEGMKRIKEIFRKKQLDLSKY